MGAMDALVSHPWSLASFPIFSIIFIDEVENVKNLVISWAKGNISTHIFKFLKGDFVRES